MTTKLNQARAGGKWVYMLLNLRDAWVNGQTTIFYTGKFCLLSDKP